ncbi:MAG TPA: hypothetical protein VGQ89_12055 [Candidatus Limnocylindrales bacterium]|nr:hypothetical protein [Candidatus Limnocylindrales bacterium]
MLLIAEAHNPQDRVRVCLPYIAGTHDREANGPDPAGIGLEIFQFMRLSYEQQAIRALSAMQRHGLI